MPRFQSRCSFLWPIRVLLLLLDLGFLTVPYSAGFCQALKPIIRCLYYGLSTSSSIVLHRRPKVSA